MQTFPEIALADFVEEGDRLRFEATIRFSSTDEKRFIGIIPGTTRAVAGNLAGRILKRRDFEKLAKYWVEELARDGWFSNKHLSLPNDVPGTETLGSVTGYLHHCIERMRRGD